MNAKEMRELALKEKRLDSEQCKKEIYDKIKYRAEKGGFKITFDCLDKNDFHKYLSRNSELIKSIQSDGFVIKRYTGNQINPFDYYEITW